MQKYFFDTSALAKVYRKEIGSDSVDRILAEPGSQHIISRLTILEMESVFAIKVRTGEIDQQSLLMVRRRLATDLGRRRLLLAAVNDEHFRTARKLLFKHGAVEALRTLDALQLSVALSLNRAGLVTVFVAADQKLCRVATLEGFTVTNPEQPTSIVP
ncbi:MAG: type II toxin-antitoxin system VapC family toxin [Bryobacteraceae bacterium]